MLFDIFFKLFEALSGSLCLDLFLIMLIYLASLYSAAGWSFRVTEYKHYHFSSLKAKQSKVSGLSVRERPETDPEADLATQMNLRE